MAKQPHQNLRAPIDEIADSLRSEWIEDDIRKKLSGIRTKLRGRGGDAAIMASCLPAKGRCSLNVPGPMIHIKS